MASSPIEINYLINKRRNTEYIRSQSSLLHPLYNRRIPITIKPRKARKILGAAHATDIFYLFIRAISGKILIPKNMGFYRNSNYYGKVIRPRIMSSMFIEIWRNLNKTYAVMHMASAIATFLYSCKRWTTQANSQIFQNYKNFFKNTEDFSISILAHQTPLTDFEIELFSFWFTSIRVNIFKPSPIEGKGRYSLALKAAREILF